MIGALSARVQSSSRYRWILMVTVTSGMMMAVLSSSIVNIALQRISVEFDTSIPTTLWVATIYMIVQAVFMPVAGRAGDLYGHKRVYITGLLIFTSMSILCTFAWNIESLIAGRALMALGTSALAPMALFFVMDAFPGRQRGPALGVMGGIMGAAPTVGMVGGGFLVGGFGWRSVFLVAVPLCAIILPVAFVVLKQSDELVEDRGFDVPGGLFLTIGLFAGLLSLSQGRFWGWDDGRTLAGLAIMVVLIVLFVIRERRAPRPMLDLGLLRFRSLVSANVAGFFSSGAMFGSFVLLPFFFQSVIGDSPSSTGLRIAPLALAFLLVAPLGGRLTNSIGARNTPHIGLAIAALGFFALSQAIVADTTILMISVAIAVLGIGLGLTMAPLTTVALHDVPPDKRGIASSLPQMSRFIGGSFGMAVTGTFLAWRVSSRLAERGVGARLSADAAADSAIVSANPVLQDAFSSAFHDVFLFSLLLIAASFAAVFFVPQLKSKVAGDGGDRQ
ncbi:MAG: DHA2 family efflux MFS transporter permease subunit [Thermoleophilia bacterium]